MDKIPMKAVRAIKGWTQQDLADKMGVSRATVNRWEQGKLRVKPIYMFKFCSITGFKEEDIFLPEIATNRSA